jgi:hypothetical protein
LHDGDGLKGVGGMKLLRESGLDDIFGFLDSTPIVTILFIDQTDFCRHYAQSSWVQDEANVVEVDQEIVEHFQIGKVPQFRFYLNGSEVASLVGTVPREDIVKMKREVFGELPARKRI